MFLSFNNEYGDDQDCKLMTFILGSRCRDGVALVADKKITSTNEVGSITFEYRQKIFGVLGGSFSVHQVPPKHLSYSGMIS